MNLPNDFVIYYRNPRLLKAAESMYKVVRDKPRPVNHPKQHPIRSWDIK